MGATAAGDKRCLIRSRMVSLDASSKRSRALPVFGVERKVLRKHSGMGWKDGSLSKGLAMQARAPVFGSLAPMLK